MVFFSVWVKLVQRTADLGIGFRTGLGPISEQLDGRFWLDCVECFVGISIPQLVLRTKLSLLEFE